MSVTGCVKGSMRLTVIYTVGRCLLSQANFKQILGILMILQTFIYIVTPTNFALCCLLFGNYPPNFGIYVKLKFFCFWVHLHHNIISALSQSRALKQTCLQRPATRLTSKIFSIFRFSYSRDYIVSHSDIVVF